MRRSSPDERKWMGVARFAPDVVWLTKKSMDLNEEDSEGKSLGYLRRIPGHHVTDVHELIKALEASCHRGARGDPGA